MTGLCLSRSLQYGPGTTALEAAGKSMWMFILTWRTVPRDPTQQEHKLWPMRGEEREGSVFHSAQHEPIQENAFKRRPGITSLIHTLRSRPHRSPPTPPHPPGLRTTIQIHHSPPPPPPQLRFVVKHIHSFNKSLLDICRRPCSSFTSDPSVLLWQWLIEGKIQAYFLSFLIQKKDTF